MKIIEYTFPTIPDDIPNDINVRMDYTTFKNMVDKLQRNEMLICYNVTDFKQQLKTILYRNDVQHEMRSFNSNNTVIIVRE